MAKTRKEIYESRPLSPHLTIYKKQISSVLSIFHRLSGVGAYCGLSVISWWFILWVFSKFDPKYINFASDNIFFKLVVFGTVTAVFFHLCTGIRHLIWDTGRGFSIKCVNRTGIAAVCAFVVISLIFWMWVL